MLLIIYTFMGNPVNGYRAIIHSDGKTVYYPTPVFFPLLLPPLGERRRGLFYPTIMAFTTALHGPVSPLRFTQRSQYQAIFPACVTSNLTT